MITVEQIRSVDPTKADDYAKTQSILKKFNVLRVERVPFFLTFEEFDEILRWKLRGQYGRQEERRRPNTDELIRSISQACFSISHNDFQYETDARVSVLCAIRGVGVPVASAILTIVEPERYGVIDIRGWRQVFGERKFPVFSLSDYRLYLPRIREIARQTGMTPQQVDFAIWVYDEKQGSEPRSS